MMKAVYSPCQENLEYYFDSRRKELEAGKVTVLSEGEANLVVDKFKRFGVGFVARKPTPTSLKERKEAWEQGNRAWAEDVVSDWHQEVKAKKEAGIKVEEPERVKTAKKFLKMAVLAVLLLLPGMSYAQQEVEQQAGNFTYKYDVASSSLTYCYVDGANGPLTQGIRGPGTIETSGASTTVTGVDADDDVFAAVSAGDILIVGSEIRVITAKASADQVTVNSNLTLTGDIWSYKNMSCGTASTDGWITVAGWSTVQLTVQYDAGDLDTLDVAFYCKERGLGASAVRVYPGPSSDCGDGTLSGTVCTFATPGQGLSYKIPHNAFDKCRVGLKYGSSDGGTREEVTTTISVTR